MQNRRILSLWAEVSLELLPKSESTREWDKNMETDLSGLSFIHCAVTRKINRLAHPCFGSISKKKKLQVIDSISNSFRENMP